MSETKDLAPKTLHLVSIFARTLTFWRYRGTIFLVLFNIEKSKSLGHGGKHREKGAKPGGEQERRFMNLIILDYFKRSASEVTYMDAPKGATKCLLR